MFANLLASKSGKLADVTDLSAAHESARRPLTIGVLGAKGGVGGTTVAVNLAAALSEEQSQSILVDADLQQPSAAIMLGQHPTYGLVDLCQRCQDPEDTLLSACSQTVDGCNMRVINPPLDGSGALNLTLTEVSQCLTQFRQFASTWIIDLPKHLDRHLVTLMDACDRVVLVFEPTITAVAAAKRWIDLLGELGYTKEKVICVVNRSGGRLRVIEDEIASCNIFDQLFRLPNAFDLTEMSATKASPAVLRAPNKPYAKAVQELANYISGASVHE